VLALSLYRRLIRVVY